MSIFDNITLQLSTCYGEDNIVKLTDCLYEAHKALFAKRRGVDVYDGPVTTELDDAAHADAERHRPYFYDLATEMVRASELEEEVMADEEGWSIRLTPPSSPRPV